MSPCPSSPNCVSSEPDADEAHRVAPLPLAEMEALRAAVESIPRCRVEQIEGDVLHATCRTLVLRFVDDVHLRIDHEAGTTQVRSASRVGHSDLGVNGRRVEKLRAALTPDGR
ncbi:MAG: DUF1499 domain-containing protein [Alphaproteobacteria bacterium]|nr:DUF1499 domain-containing protein [Alphaproteobacteria bacterium]MCB9699249.1 DUF1499 domain-containing protein [Alphaproteobacteria bacterium]